MLPDDYPVRPFAARSDAAGFAPAPHISPCDPYASPASGGTDAPGAFGVDYQQTASRICLREGRDVHAPARSVGDGVRDLIPHSVQSEGLWGSPAWLPQTRQYEAPSVTFGAGPWLQTPDAGRFWQGLHRRLYDYLGQMEPTSASGYQVMVGVQGEDMADAMTQVQALCAQNGLPEAVVLPAPDAVLCRWIVEGASGAGGQTAQSAQAQTVAVVVVGDVAASVTAYRIVWPGQERAKCLARRGMVTTWLPTGQAWWIEEMRGRVRGVVSEWPPDGGGLGLRDAIIEFGARLARAPEDTLVRWTGPLRDRMFQTLQMASRDCARWPSVGLLNAGLNGAIAQACEALGGGPPDSIVIGGMGAEWPFARQSAGYEARLVWQSRSPREDVAVGAAWRACLSEFSIVQDDASQDAVQTATWNSAQDAVPSDGQDAVQEPAQCVPTEQPEQLEQPEQDEYQEETQNAGSGAVHAAAASNAALLLSQASEEAAAPSETGRGESVEAPLDAATAWLLRTGGLADKNGAADAPVVAEPIAAVRPPWLPPEEYNG